MVQEMLPLCFVAENKLNGIVFAFRLVDRHPGKNYVVTALPLTDRCEIMLLHVCHPFLFDAVLYDKGRIVDDSHSPVVQRFSFFSISR